MRSRSERTAHARPGLLRLLRSLSYKSGEVVLASGQTSDFFIDCKPAVLTAAGHVWVGELMLDALRSLPPCDSVAGVALGGCPLASAVSLTSQLRQKPVPALYVRKDTKDHGTQRQIEGSLQAGMKVVLVEDVITTGASTLRAAKVLRQAGATVVGIVALVDRLEGGAEAIKNAGIELVTLYTRHDFTEQSPLSSTLADTAVD